MFRDTFSVFERLISNMEVAEKPHNPEKEAPETPCWEWQRGLCNKGYPFLYIYCPIAKKSKSNRAHIVSWCLANGRLVGAGMTLDHKCRNTKCIRPSHLEEVTRVENTIRGNRARKVA